jgi:hypothetical protein
MHRISSTWHQATEKYTCTASTEKKVGSAVAAIENKGVER